MKKFLKGLVLTVFLLAVIGGAAAYVFRKKIVERYTPVVEQMNDIRIVIKNDTSYISSKLKITNQTFLRITIDTIRYKVTLFNTTYLESKEFLGIILPGEGFDTINFLIKIPYEEVMKELATQKKKGDSTNYSISVFLQYSTSFGRAEIPFNRSAKLKIPQPPEVEIVGINYTKIRRKKILAEAKIKIVNNSSVALSITELNYSMMIREGGDLAGNFKVPLLINPNETSYINLPIEINVNNLGKTIFRILMNKDKYNYTLNMDAAFETSDPFKRSFRIELEKNGKMELKK